MQEVSGSIPLCSTNYFKIFDFQKLAYEAAIARNRVRTPFKWSPLDRKTRSLSRATLALRVERQARVVALPLRHTVKVTRVVTFAQLLVLLAPGAVDDATLFVGRT